MVAVRKDGRVEFRRRNRWLTPVRSNSAGRQAFDVRTPGAELLAQLRTEIGGAEAEDQRRHDDGAEAEGETEQHARGRRWPTRQPRTARRREARRASWPSTGPSGKVRPAAAVAVRDAASSRRSGADHDRRAGSRGAGRPPPEQRGADHHRRAADQQTQHRRCGSVGDRVAGEAGNEAEARIAEQAPERERQYHAPGAAQAEVARQEHRSQVGQATDRGTARARTSGRARTPWGCRRRFRLQFPCRWCPVSSCIDREAGLFTTGLWKRRLLPRVASRNRNWCCHRWPRSTTCRGGSGHSTGPRLRAHQAWFGTTPWRRPLR